MRRSLWVFIFGVTFAAGNLSAFGSPTQPEISFTKKLGQNFSTVSKKLKNWGLINFKDQSHIQATEAWKIEEGNRSIVVAVIDTGIDPNHKDLAENIWHDVRNKNPTIFGWNYVTDKPNPYDDHGHGTHVAGIIGAIADPETGVSGVAHHVSIMPVKYYSDANPGAVNLRNTIKAINYAVDHGARIINYSGGGPEFSEDENLAIKKAESKGVLFISAAGNEHQDSDKLENYYYPSAYRLSNIISVAATDIHNNLLASSNWGKKNVDVTAPGENIFSTLPDGKAGYMSGTSQATAFVTGLAALLLSRNPSLTPQQLKELILASVDPFPKLKDKTVTGGRVNAYHALLLLQNTQGNVLGKAGWIAHRPASLTTLLSSPDDDSEPSQTSSQIPAQAPAKE